MARKPGARRLANKELVFADYPDFRPNLTPREIFASGSFGGTYWRPIRSNVTKKAHRGAHRRFPSSWWSGIPEDHLTREWRDYDTAINKYDVKVGTELGFWERKKWIKASHPYGWVHWYCDFYNGRRGADDERQVKRWVQTAGPRSRFRMALLNRIKRLGRRCGDYSRRSAWPRRVVVRAAAGRGGARRGEVAE